MKWVYSKALARAAEFGIQVGCANTLQAALNLECYRLRCTAPACCSCVCREGAASVCTWFQLAAICLDSAAGSHVPADAGRGQEHHSRHRIHKRDRWAVQQSDERALTAHHTCSWWACSGSRALTMVHLAACLLGAGLRANICLVCVSLNGVAWAGLCRPAAAGSGPLY